MNLLLYKPLRYSKTCLKQPSKIRPKNLAFKTSRLIITLCRSKVLQNAPMEQSIVLLTCIKLPYDFMTFVFSIFEGPLKTGFTVHQNRMIINDRAS